MHLVLILDNGKEFGRFPIPDKPGKLVVRTMMRELKITVERIDPNKPLIESITNP